MADEDKPTEVLDRAAAGSVQEPVLRKQNSQKIPVFAIPGEFKFGRNFIRINRVSLDGQDFVPQTGGSFPIEEGEEVIFIGENLGVYDKVWFTQGGPEAIRLNKENTRIEFTVPRLNIAKGAGVFLRLISDNYSQATANLAPYFTYGIEDEKEKNKKSASGTEENPEGISKPGLGPSVIGGLVNAPLGIVADGIAQGFQGKKSTGQKSAPGSASSTAGGAGKNINANQDSGGGSDSSVLETETSAQSSGAIASTTQVSTGAQTIIQGRTVSGSEQVVSGAAPGSTTEAFGQSSVQTSVASTTKVSGQAAGEGMQQATTVVSGQGAAGASGTVTNSRTISEAGTAAQNVRPGASSAIVSGTVNGKVPSPAQRSSSVDVNASGAVDQETQKQNISGQVNQDGAISSGSTASVGRANNVASSAAGGPSIPKTPNPNIGVQGPAQNINSSVKVKGEAGTETKKQVPDSGSSPTAGAQLKNLQTALGQEEKPENLSASKDKNVPGTDEKQGQGKTPATDIPKEKPKTPEQIAPQLISLSQALNANDENLERKLNKGKVGAEKAGAPQRRLDSIGDKRAPSGASASTKKANAAGGGKSVTGAPTRSVDPVGGGTGQRPALPQETAQPKDETGPGGESPATDKEDNNIDKPNEQAQEEQNQQAQQAAGQTQAQNQAAASAKKKAAGLAAQEQAAKLAGEALRTQWKLVASGAYLSIYLIVPFYIGCAWMASYWYAGNKLSKDHGLKRWQKIVTVISPFVPPVIVLMLVLFVIAGACSYWSSPFDRQVTQNLFGIKAVCDAIESTSIGSSLVNKLGGSPSSPGGPLSLSSDINQKIAAVSSQYQTDACMIKVVVQKESGGDASAIGCDCAANGKPGLCRDSSHDYYPNYVFNWDQCSYGIGLTQWTIFPKGGSGYKAWQQNPYVPSRNILGNFYDVNSLLNGDTSLSLTAQYLQQSYNKSKNPDPRSKVQDAFTTYVGQSSQTSNLVASRMALYDMCKATSP